MNIGIRSWGYLSHSGTPVYDVCVPNGGLTGKSHISSMCFCEECWYSIIIIAVSLLIGIFTLENRGKIFSV